MTSLDTLGEGAQAALVRLGGGRAFRLRLMELGLLPGTPVRLIRRADVGGVMEVEVRNCRLTLRHGDARNVLVDPLNGG